jgi:hypothetical protein
MKRIKLSFKINPYACTQHYAHFLMGLLVPLIIERDSLLKEGIEEIYIPSSDILDHLIHEIGFLEIKIADKLSYDNMIDIEHRELVGFDDPDRLYGDKFNRARDILLVQLKDKINIISKDINSKFTGLGKKILVINRAPPDPFYFTDKSLHRDISSGTHRRSLPNFKEMIDVIKSKYDNVLVEEHGLNGKSLSYQIALFQSADIIIIQHGSDMCNLIWAKNKIIQIEIYPKNVHLISGYEEYFRHLTRSQYSELLEKEKDNLENLNIIKRYGRPIKDYGWGRESENWFSSGVPKLCEQLNHTLFRVYQKSNHSPVKIDLILTALDYAYNNDPIENEKLNKEIYDTAIAYLIKE